MEILLWLPFYFQCKQKEFKQRNTHTHKPPKDFTKNMAFCDTLDVSQGKNVIKTLKSTKQTITKKRKIIGFY